MNIECMVLSKYIKIKFSDLVFNDKVTDWCKLKYYGHPNGCPNYSKSELCPPKVAFDRNTINRDNLILSITQFDFEKYTNAMKEIHPNWSDKQCRNVLYWQGQLKSLIKKECNRNGYNILLGCGSGIGVPSMEAIGINVMRTLRNLGETIETKPKKYVKLVCVCGYSDCIEI